MGTLAKSLRLVLDVEAGIAPALVSVFTEPGEGGGRDASFATITWPESEGAVLVGNRVSILECGAVAEEADLEGDSCRVTVLSSIVVPDEAPLSRLAASALDEVVVLANVEAIGAGTGAELMRAFGPRGGLKVESIEEGGCCCCPSALDELPKLPLGDGGGIDARLATGLDTIGPET